MEDEVAFQGRRVHRLRHRSALGEDFGQFLYNACVLINKAGEPIGSRVSGVVAAELRQKQWSKILSLAPMHV